jgi:CRP/FNR family transcriptional regulator, cyclic AMP receptor protein
MSKSIRPEDLRSVPLFRGISADHVDTLTSAFERSRHAAGHVLFRAGDRADRFLILLGGEVTLKEGDDDRFRLRPVAPIGELGALTGLPRNTEAKAATDVEILSIPTPKLLRVFEEHADVAFRFYQNLLTVVSDKVARDRRRLDDMRRNLVRTQKAMKTLRELVLSNPETPISKPLFEGLDELISNNRRAHYRVAPVPALPASFRMDDGSVVLVVELSAGYLKLDLPAAKWPKGTELSAVMVLPAGDFPVSGRVERAGTDGVVLKLDLLIDEYQVVLEDYLTRLQLLDFVV